MIVELYSIVLIYVNGFMIIGYFYELWLCAMIYELLYMSLDYKFTLAVGVYDLWINTAVIRKHVRFNCVRKAGRRSYPLTRAADLGQMLVVIIYVQKVYPRFRFWVIDN